jgi:hypothetical protein
MQLEYLFKGGKRGARSFLYTFIAIQNALKQPFEYSIKLRLSLWRLSNLRIRGFSEQFQTNKTN